MQLLQEFFHTDFFGGQNKDAANFSHRFSARAIVRNQNSEIALMHVARHAYYKLPGGGIEAGEDTQQALERELLEELGCKAKIVAEVGKTVEYRDEWSQKQTSFCFIAEQVGETIQPNFTADEIADAYEVIWAKNIAAAIDLVEQSAPQEYGGQFMRARDLAFLKAASSKLY